MPNPTLPLLDTLSDYANWTASLWVGSTSEGVKDLAVMGLGLPGECAEVAEQLVAVDRCPTALCKELGDVIYYWARIQHSRAVPLETIWSDCPSPPVCDPRALAFELCLAAGQVAEGLKKHIRDDADLASSSAHGRLTVPMRRLSAAWQAAVASSGMTVLEVLAANRAKLEDRRVRNVMQGSGDER